MLAFLKKIKSGSDNEPEVDAQLIKKMLDKHKDKIKLFMNSCIHCSLCAESCFLQTSHKDDPTYMPSHKLIHSIGKLYKRKGKVTRRELEEIRDIVWGKCALCTRCYCPVHIDIPEMVALARAVCRSQGVYPAYEEQGGAASGFASEEDVEGMLEGAAG